MTTSRTAAASILLSLVLVSGLAACTPTSTTTDTGTDSGVETDTETETDDDGFAGVTLSGTGDYVVPSDAPIGGYELPDNQDALPDGCSWTSYVGDDVLGESNGPFVFLTDVTTRFVTEGCPDWVQFE